MAFRKTDRISNRAWGDVDTTALRNRLVAGLEEGADGVEEAIREVYAVLRGETLREAPSQNWWGPHHEVTDAGDLVLNRGGVIAAGAAVVGARNDPDLTDEQRRAAARHIIRHYRTLELPVPEGLAQAAGTGEIVRLTAEVAGEMSVEDVPVASWVDLARLKAGDPDPLEVVVSVPEGKSRRGWYYERRVLERIASEINTTGLPGILGHQKSEDVDSQFPTPVTHWVGAMVREEGGKAVLYARGVVDQAASNLKRWIRAGVIRQVSIFGAPALQHANGETRVVDYQPLSIDWTPLNRAGMPTAIVAVGEMDTILAAGTTGTEGGGDMTLQELLAELRKLNARPSQVLGEMQWQAGEVLNALGLSFEDLAKAVGGDRYTALTAAEAAAGEVAQAFGLPADTKPADLVAKVKAAVQFAGEVATALGVAGGAKPEDVVAAAKRARAAEETAAKAQHEALVTKVIGEMVPTEAARPLVRRMLTLEPGADEASIRKVVGELLDDQEVKAALNSVFRQPVPRPRTGNDKDSGNLRRAAVQF